MDAAEVAYSVGVSADSFLSIIVLGYLFDALLMGIVLVRPASQRAPRARPFVSPWPPWMARTHLLTPPSHLASTKCRPTFKTSPTTGPSSSAWSESFFSSASSRPSATWCPACTRSASTVRPSPRQPFELGQAARLEPQRLTWRSSTRRQCQATPSASSRTSSPAAPSSSPASATLG
jgi:hypothetical protein